MCDRVGCAVEGNNVPQVVNRIRAAGREWDVPMIVGLRVCDTCKKTITKPTEILSEEELAKLTRGLLGMRAGARLVSQRLSWITTDHEHYKALMKGPAGPREVN